MKYPEYNTRDFIEDSYFRKWIQEPDAGLDAFWAKFLEEFPQKINEVTVAKNFLLALEEQVKNDFSTQLNEDIVFQRIKQDIENDEAKPVRRLPLWPAWVAAACVVLLTGWWYTNQKAAPSWLSYEMNRSLAEMPLTEKINNTSATMLIKLADGSSVFLKPNSKISYAGSFETESKREVYLSGEAFFEVAKNPDKPFYVYANELITKVLGTSFNVQAFQDDKNVTVKVSTGRVSVAVASEIRNTKTASGNLDGVLLLPNQQAILSRQEVSLVKTLVDDPALLKGNPVNAKSKPFVFEAVPAAKVFKILEQAYGVAIEFDETLFTNCQFTADLTDENLYEKLNIICKSIEANYQILDARIIVNGKGCN